LNELEKIKSMNDVSLKAMQNQIDMVKNELRICSSNSNQTHLQLRLRLLRKSVLLVEVLIRTTNVLPPVATLSQSTGITFKTNEIKNMMASLLHMNTASTSGSGTLPGNTIANPKGELKAITTRSGLVSEGHIVPNPPKSVNLEEDEYVEETYTDPDHAEYNIK
nr:reverse transcriptase domain-containing protein [Tanacetum cinerariifolium]